MKSQATFEVLLRGVLGKDGLYSFGNILPTISSTGGAMDTATIQPSVNFADCNSLFSSSDTHSTTTTSPLGPTTYTLWHYRLGHPHDEALNIILSICKVPLPNKTFFDFFFLLAALGKYIVFQVMLL